LNSIFFYKAIELVEREINVSTHTVRFFRSGYSNKLTKTVSRLFFLADWEVAEYYFSPVVAIGMSDTNLLNGHSLFSLIPPV